MVEKYFLNGEQTDCSIDQFITMKQPRFYLIALIFSGALFFSSCSDDSNLITNSDTLDNSEISLRTDESLDLPTVNDDRFSFRDYDHLTDYYLTLDELYSLDEQEFNEVAAHISDEVTTVHNKLFSDVFVNPEDRYQPFLTDPIMMTIVNEYFEFEVDGILITYMNNSDLLRSKASDVTTRNEIRQMEKGMVLDFDAIPKNAFWGDDSNELSFKPICHCDIKVEKISCTEVKISGSCGNLFGGSGGGTVSWNTSSSTSTALFDFMDINNPAPGQTSVAVDGNFEFIVDVQNILGQLAGSVLVQVNPNCFFGQGNIKRIVFIFDPTQDLCDSDERSTGWLWSTDGYSQGMSHRTSTYYNSWSHYAEAKLYSKWWSGSNWQENKSDLEATIEEQRRNFNCFEDDFEEETNSCGNCKSRHARVNIGWNNQLVFHCDGDVTGTFKKSLDWNNFQWTIDAVDDVDYECFDCN